MELLEAVDWPWVLVWSGLAGAAAMAWHAWRAGVRQQARNEAERLHRAMVEHYRRYPLGGIPGNVPDWHPDSGRVVSIRGLEDDDARWQRGREGR